MHLDEGFDLKDDGGQDQLTSWTNSGESFLHLRSSLEGSPAGSGGWGSPKTDRQDRVRIRSVSRTGDRDLEL